MQYSIYCPKCEKENLEPEFEERLQGTGGEKIIRCSRHLGRALLRVTDGPETTEKAEIGLSDQQTVALRDIKMEMHTVIRKGPAYTGCFNYFEAKAVVDHIAAMKEIIAGHAWLKEDKLREILTVEIKKDLQPNIQDIVSAINGIKDKLGG